MKVLQYATSLTRSAGGLYYSVSGLSKGLHDLGIQVSVVGGGGANFEEDRHIWGDVPIYPHSMRLGGYGFDLRTIAEIRRQKPDLVHIHGIWSAGSIYGRIASAMNIPVVVSPRGMLDPWILARRPNVKAAHSILLEKPLLRKAYLHALNEPEREAVIAFMPSLKDRIFVVPNGIPHADNSYRSSDKMGALYIGRLHPKKQVLELIKAWQTLPAANEHLLTIAGWGDPSYEASVKEACAGCSNVEFVGSLYGEEKAEALRKARFFLLPSLSEGLPMAVLEAIQFGCIPIITNECNLPELFLDGIAHRIMSDFSDFESVVTAVLKMPESDMQDLSNAASSYAQRYLWATIANDVLTQYQRILRAD